MRLALVTQEFPPETARGGIGTQAFAKAHGMAARGHQVWVISHSTDAARHEYAQNKVQIRRVPGFDAQLSLATDEARWLTYSVLVAAEIERLHREITLDLVEFADWGSEGYAHLLNRVDWNYLPAVIHLHGPVVMFAHAIGWPSPTSRFFQVAREMERTCLQLADAVYSSSRCSAEWCAEHYGLELNRIPVIHTGVDLDLFRPMSPAKSARPTVIFVGKLERNKGVDRLVEAACQLAEEIPDLCVRLVGGGSRELVNSLLDLATRAGFPRLVEVAGFVRPEALPAELCPAHVLAVPSVYEGGPGFVYLEAMACGLPVIACSGSGAAEVIQPEETGLLVPPDDGAALVAALRRLLTNDTEREQMGQRALRYVACEADRRVCLDRIESFYLQVITAGQRRRRPDSAVGND